MGERSHFGPIRLDAPETIREIEPHLYRSPRGDRLLIETIQSLDVMIEQAVVVLLIRTTHLVATPTKRNRLQDLVVIDQRIGLTREVHQTDLMMLPHFSLHNNLQGHST